MCRYIVLKKVIMQSVSTARSKTMRITWFFVRDGWWRQQRKLEVMLNMELTPQNVILAMLKSKYRSDTVNKYITVVLTKKEADVRARGEIEEYYKRKQLYIAISCGLKGKVLGTEPHF